MTRPVAVVRLDAAEIPPARWWRYVRHRRIFCAHGHHIPHTFGVTEAGFIRCAHWIATRKAECGAWLFLLAIRGGGIIAVEIDQSDKGMLETMTTPAEMLDFLGIWP